MRISVLLVDDHPIFLAGLRALIEDQEDMKVAGVAPDGTTAIEMIQNLSPDVVVMDITMPGLSGIEATKKAVSAFPGTKVIALSIHSGQKFVEDMLKAGASGYIVKETVPEELVKAVRMVMNGQVYLSPSITGLIVSQFRKDFSEKPSENQDRCGIIETKLSVPQVTDDYVLRNRLVNMLDENRHLPIQNVIAPAGYGKSTLVSSWLKGNDWPHAWLNLGENDNDLQRFVTYFICAIQTLFPSALESSSNLVSSDGSIPVQTLAEKMIIELELIETDFILVIDDIQMIKEKKIHDLISELFRHPPKVFHLIIIGRIDPFLPVSNLRARGQLAEIRLRDLKFTLEETEDFLTQTGKKTVEKNISQSVLEKTEGWITSLRLASLSIKHDNDLTSMLSELEGGAKYVMEYLFSEVLSALAPEVQDGLMKLSILDRFCAPLCNAVFTGKRTGKGPGGIDGLQLISLLRKENMFIIELDADNVWYRYHHMFKQMLYCQLISRALPEKISDLHDHASGWFIDHQFLNEAIHHAIAAGKIETAVQIIEQNRFRMIDEGQYHKIALEVEKLPFEIRQSNLDLLFCQAWIMLDNARINQVQSIVEKIERAMNSDISDSKNAAEYFFFKGVIAYFLADSHQSAKFLTKSIDLYGPQTFMVLKFGAEYWYCMALHLGGSKNKALQRLNDGLHKKYIQEKIMLSRLTFGLCFIYMLESEFSKAVQESTRLETIGSMHHLVDAEVWGHYVHGNAALQMFDLNTAHRCFTWIMEHKELSSSRVVIDSMAGLAITCQLMGKPRAETDRVVATAMTVAQRLEDAISLEIIYSCRSRIALMRGDLDEAGRWQQEFSSISGDLVILFFLEIPVITACRVLIAGKSEVGLNRAMGRLERLAQKTVLWQNTSAKVEIMVLQALVRYHQKRTDEALPILQEAVTFVKTGKGLRPFIEAGPPMVNMLNHMLTRDMAPDTVHWILSIFNEHEQRISSVMSKQPELKRLKASTNIPQPLVEPLTQREMEILGLLGQHFYNKEIAERLFISTETVKTHLKRIYGKLEVGNRRDAVSKAKELSLIAVK